MYRDGKKPTEKFRKDYQPPHYFVKNVDLTFQLFDGKTLVHSKLVCQRNPRYPAHVDFLLDGEELELQRLAVDGTLLQEGAGYNFTEAGQLCLSGKALPASHESMFTLECSVQIKPEQNLRLSGLYKSNALYCTQCEAEGFRRITFFPDRPDVMSVYRCTVEADKTKCPVLLSNGNLVASGDLPYAAGRHFATFTDPWPKPCYLFALVAGDLGRIQGTFTTMSGKTVNISIWSEHDNVTKLDHAMASIKKAMKWDEEAYGREYDLEVFNIVAVNDFNMGAMENKSLNVFNTSAVLATKDISSDDDLLRVEGIIGHEYFHNWTGNRVTCRDWFQLTLKEGLTVFRDQSFSAAMNSPAVKKIEDVIFLRSVQFPEDAGPMQHPIRPESVIAMDNFYTSTVYRKGARVIDMYKTLLGDEGFRKGTDLYFQRHDGEAVTCDDFRAAMADASGKDLTQFERWYFQAGTPEVEVCGAKWDSEKKTYSITFRQHTPNGPADASGTVKLPFHIPVRIGLLDKRTGREMLESVVCELREEAQTFEFNNVCSEPVPSILRGFSAPVKLRNPLMSDEDLALLLAKDTDAFCKWDAGQQLATKLILATYKALSSGASAPEVPAWFIEAFRQLLLTVDSGDRALLAYALRLPGESTLEGDIPAGELNPSTLHDARDHVRNTLAVALKKEFADVYQKLSAEAQALNGVYRLTPEDVGRRRLRNGCLSFIFAACATSGRVQEGAELAYAHFVSANNMTDKLAALNCLVEAPGEMKESALSKFYHDAKGDALVINKWFSLQAGADLPDTIERVKALTKHADFTFKNPNRFRSVIAVFAGSPRFHSANGEGYRMIADMIIEVDKMNPTVAAKLATILISYKKYVPALQALMKGELKRILETGGLSAETFEIVSKGLK